MPRVLRTLVPGYTRSISYWNSQANIPLRSSRLEVRTPSLLRAQQRLSARKEAQSLNTGARFCMFAVIASVRSLLISMAAFQVAM
ncbi:hypothetical protein MCEMSEM18_01804 [Comamonadaceae bacterium]